MGQTEFTCGSEVASGPPVEQPCVPQPFHLYKQASSHNGSPHQTLAFSSTSADHMKTVVRKHINIQSETQWGKKKCVLTHKCTKMLPDLKKCVNLHIYTKMHAVEKSNTHTHTEWNSDLEAHIPFHYNNVRRSRSWANHCQAGSKLPMKPHLPLTFWRNT